MTASAAGLSQRRAQERIRATTQARLVGRAVQAEREVPASPPPASAPVPWQDARLLAEVLEHVRLDYVDTVTDQELIEAAIRGMIADLDPHSAFLDREQFDEIRISTTGEYSGVGIEVTLDNGKEFANFKSVEQATGIRVYFADAYCAWRVAPMKTPTDCCADTFPKVPTSPG